jgi:single-strand DNA-binding protein
MNNINLIGNLVRDPDMKFLPNSEKAVTNFTIAVQRPFKSDETDFINIVVFGKTAENCATYLKKGLKAGVTGYLTIRKWQTKEGENRYTTEVIANNVEFLTPKSAQDGNTTSGSYAASFDDMTPIEDSDIPF